MAEQLAALVRAKYPGVYDDLSDADLEAAVQAKYPGVYDDLVSKPDLSGVEEPALAVSHEPEPPSSFLKRLGDAAYTASPLPLFERKNLSGTLATIAGAGTAAATGGLALPVLAAGLVGAGTSAATGEGDPLTEGFTQGAVQVMGMGAPRVLGTMGRRLYQGAAKIPLSVASKARGGAPAIVETGLQERIPVSRGGVEKISRIVGGLDQEVDRAVSGSTATVDPRRVLRRLGDTVREFSEQVTPETDLRQIGDVGREFARRTLPRGAMPVSQAQTLKQGTYRRLAKDYGKTATASAEAQKSLARGLRSEIESAVPEVVAPNARMSRLLDLSKALDRTRVENRDIIGLSDIIAAGINPKTLPLSFAMRPGVQSRLGIAAHDAGRMDPNALAIAIRALLAGQEP